MPAATESDQFDFFVSYARADNTQGWVTRFVEEHLAACASRVPGLVSTYHWDEAVHEDAEVLLVIKTTRDRFEALRERLLGVHPYELPEIIAVEASAGHAPYLDWITASTRADRSP